MASHYPNYGLGIFLTSKEIGNKAASWIVLCLWDCSESLCPSPKAWFHNMTCCMVLMKITAITLSEGKKKRKGRVGGREGGRNVKGHREKTSHTVTNQIYILLCQFLLFKISVTLNHKGRKKTQVRKNPHNVIDVNYLFPSAYLFTPACFFLGHCYPSWKRTVPLLI